MHGLKGYYFKKLVAIDKDKEGFLFSFIFNSIRKNGEVRNKSNNIMSKSLVQQILTSQSIGTEASQSIPNSFVPIPL